MALSARRAAFAPEECEGPCWANEELEDEDEDVELEADLQPMLPNVGTPGPGTYDLPSCFRPRHHRGVGAVESAFVLSNGMAATLKGRHFLPDPSDPKPGPGPQHYQPQLVYDSSHVRCPTMLFSTASRAKNQRLYISPFFAVDLLGKDAPGPGTYRVGFGRRPGRQAPGPRNYGAATFGNGPQRPGPAREALAVPGPIYDVSASTSPRPPGPRWAADVGPAHREAHEARAAASKQAQQQERALPSCGGGRRAVSGPGSVVAATGAHAAAEANTAAADDSGCCADTSSAGGRPLSSDAPSTAGAAADGQGSNSNAGGRPKLGKLQLAGEHNGRSRWYGKPAIGDATTPKPPMAVFGTEKISAQRTAKVYLNKELTDHNPALSDSPGPVYYPAAACMAGQVRPGPRWSSTPRHPSAKEPFISKLHAQSTAGDCSPGPAAYNVRTDARDLFVADRRCSSPLASINSSCHNSFVMRTGASLLGDGRSMKFGSGQRLAPLELPGADNPGPGAYTVLQDTSSTQRTAPSFSLGVDLRSAPASASASSSRSPGPGSSDAPAGVGSRGAAYSPAFSLYGRLEHGGIVAKSSTPGPGAYDPRTGLADGLRDLGSSIGNSSGGSSSSSVPQACGSSGTERPRTKGYSMGGKLPASDETPSPGPGAYKVKEGLTQPYSGAALVTSRTVARQYISPLHEQSEAGACSPGPAAYQLQDPTVLSTHSQGGAFSFGTEQRSDMAKTKF